MDPERVQLTRRVTFILLALAATATEIAAVDSRPVVQSLGLAAAWVGLALGLGWLVPPPRLCSPQGEKEARLSTGVLPRFGLLALVGLAAVPFAVEPFRRRWTGDGYPLELQMVFALRNVGLGLAALAHWPVCLRLASIVSLFLMLFAVSMTDHRAVVVLLGLYGAAGSVWLMLVYWTDLRTFFGNTDAAAALDVQAGRERLPWPALVVAVGLVASVLGLVAIGPRRAARVLAEWLPTSGGTGDMDPFARGGLNDGDDAIDGPNARSAGMVTDTFIESPLPSLYDMFIEQYGEPFQPKEREQAIGLDAQTKVNESRKPPPENLRANREFPTARQGSRQPRDASSRRARALFEVQGRTPLHVRVTAYDTFDGIAWHEAASRARQRGLHKEPDSCWMNVPERLPERLFAGVEDHQFKVAESFGSVVPAPAHLKRFRLGRVNRPDFFTWSQDGILRLAKRKLPAGVCVETEAHMLDRRLLPTIHFPGPGNAASAIAVPDGYDPKLAALAEAWVGMETRGWAQINAIVERLRSEYRLEPRFRLPDDCTDPLGYFLMKARRGPDYQFAGATVLLLRQLGYLTRLVTGFYVSPEHYDPEARHTPVVQEDLHFWAEVMLPSGDWLVLEATPGYDVLGSSVPWTERLLTSLLAVASWGGQHAPELTLLALGIGGVCWRRRQLLDYWEVACWRWLGCRCWKACVRRAVLLLERRGSWAGRPRLPSETVVHWLSASQPAGDDGLADLARMADWAAYGAELAPPWAETEVRHVCRRMLERWTVARWRKIDTRGNPL